MVLQKLLRAGEGKMVRRLKAIADAVNNVEADFLAMTDAELRAETDNGANINSVTERVFFRERATTGAALRIWTAVAISTAIDRVRRAERATMAPSNAGTVLSDAAMLGVARMAARQRG